MFQLSPAETRRADPDEVAAASNWPGPRDHLLGLQDPRGWWIGRLETNVTMDAEDVLLRHFLGILTVAVAAETRRLDPLAAARGRGTWANFYGGPGDLSTTVEAYVALRLAGDDPEAGHMQRAADWITSQGGVTATRVFTRIWLVITWRALHVLRVRVVARQPERDDPDAEHVTPRGHVDHQPGRRHPARRGLLGSGWRFPGCGRRMACR